MPTTEHPLTADAVTRGPNHHYFGYYDKFQTDRTGRYLVCLESPFMDRPQRPGEAAVIGIVDTANGNAWTPLAETRAWNWQQGTMLHGRVSSLRAPTCAQLLVG